MLRRHPPALLLAGCLAASAAEPGRASTFLYTHYGPSVYEPGFFRFLTPADGTFTTYRYGPGERFLQIYFTPAPSSSLTFGFVHLGPTAGEPLAPGVYLNTSQSETSQGPFLDVDVTGYCHGGVGRFDLHEIAFDGGGEVVAISLDFEQHCSEGTTIVGALRFHTGDAACSAVPDATPCDDGDPCTAGDACHDGSCGGIDGVSAGCTASDGCNDAGTCDHRTGACRAVGRQDRTSCDDADACTATSTCTDGVCIGADPITCDDGSLCTRDRCEPTAGCVFEPKPGTCWVARPEVRGIATAHAGGHSARCTLRCQSPGVWTVFLQEDGTYLSPGGPASCSGRPPVTFPDEIGTLHATRRRLFLEPANLGDIRAAVAACVGGRPRAYRTWLEGPLDGPTIEVRNLSRVRVRGRISVLATTRSMGRFVRGVSPSGAISPPPTSPGLPTCDASLRPRCVTD